MAVEGIHPCWHLYHLVTSLVGTMSSAAYSAQIQNTLMPALAAVRDDIARVDGDIAD